MALFKNDHDLKDQLAAAQAEVVEHEAVIAKRESDIITVTEQMATINSQLETVSAELETVTAANAEMTTEFEAVKTDLEESMSAQIDFDNKVESAAVAKMAELGVKEPIEVLEEDDTTDLYSQYRKLKSTDPAQAGAFWRANEAQIKASI